MMQLKIFKPFDMKLNLLNSILLLLFIASCNSCNSSQNGAHERQKNDALVVNHEEDFDKFIKLFYSDSLFQISRIIFPLESEKKSEEEYTEALKDSNINEVGKNNHTFYDKSNWIMLTDTPFKNDSIAIIDGVKYKRRFDKTSKLVEENILYAYPEQVMIILRFQLINKKWYLVDFKNGFADE